MRTVTYRLRHSLGAVTRGLFCLTVLSGLVSCSKSSPTPATRWRPPKSLADLNIFRTEGNKLVHEPAEGVIPYDLNSPLFSDYTTKYRFIKLPTGAKARYHETEVMDFPVGTIIAKTFSYLHDLRDSSKGERLLETRILLRRDEKWEAFSYQWNDEQTSASLNLAGDVVPVSWMHSDGEERKLDYIVPDANKCISCHESNKTIVPIGPKARHLNRDYDYQGSQENQLVHWTKAGVLEGAPSNPAAAPRNAVWDDPSTGSLDERARAWIEINCQHCHQPNGPAKNAGLDFTITQKEPQKLGVWKSPIAVGRGGGDHKFSIVPGKPEQSILYFRIASDDPGVMMPEIARRLVHKEGVELIREWIASMPDPAQASDKVKSGGE